MAPLTSPPVLSYAPRQRWVFTRTHRTLAVIAAALVLISTAMGALPPWWAEQREVCTQCGSVRTQTATWFGRRVRIAIKPTALHAWIVAREGSHPHDWKYIGSTDSTGVRACGTAPASYSICSFDDFLATASDADVAALAAGLRHPDEREQEAAVQRFGDAVSSTHMVAQHEP